MLRLDDSESGQLITPLTIETLSYIGAPNEGTNLPTFTYNRAVGPTNNLTTAIDVLDNEIIGRFVGGFATVPIGVNQNIQLNFDGATGTTYIRSYTADSLEIVCGGLTMAQFVNSGDDYVLFPIDVILNPTQALRFDGSSVGNTYIQESSADVLRMVVGGNESIRISNNGGATDVYFPNSSTYVGLPQGSKLYFDGQGAATDTYITCPSNDILDFFVGGALLFRIVEGTNDYVLINGTADLVIESGNLIHLDGNVAGNTYISESSPDIIALTAGGVTSLEVKQTQVEVYTDLIIQSDDRLYFDGGTNTYAIYDSANTQIDWYIGGTNIAKIDNDSGFGIVSAFSGTGIQVNLATASSVGRIGTVTAHALQIMTDNNTRLEISSTGVFDFNSNELTGTRQVAKAWAKVPEITSGTDVPDRDYNVTNVTRNSQGNYTVNFTNSIGTSDYCAVGIPIVSSGDNDIIMVIKSQTPTSVTLQISDSTGPTIDRPFHILIFG